MDQYSEDEVRRALTPYHGRIRSVIEAGLAEWLSISECRTEKGFAPVLYQRTATNYIFDAIARNGRSVFGRDRSVRVLDEAQTVKFCFGDVVIGRFKRGDDENLGQNILTFAVLDYIDPQQTLPGFPPEAAKVEFVWSLNDLGDEIASILVVARDGDRALWSYEIDADVGGNVIPLPTPKAPEDDGAPLVTPKVKPADDAEGK